MFVSFLCVALCSCEFAKAIVEEIPESYGATNVYKDLNMAVFKDFVDKMSLKDLLEIHGQPDSIFDSYDVAAIDGYDIYEYTFPDGNIDCYVRKRIDKSKSLVEYIYYEPSKNLMLSEFVLSDSLRALMQGKSSNVYYIGDEFYNIVRFRLEKGNKNEIVNVGLNDITLLEERKTMSANVQKLNKNVPIQFGDLGLISKCEFLKGELQIFITVREHGNLDVPTIATNNPKWAEILAIRSFGPEGFLRWMSSDMIRENVGVRFYLQGNSSGKKVEGALNAQTFRNVFDRGVSNKEWLANSVAFDNLTLPEQVTDWMICGKQRIENNCLVLTFGLKGAKDDYVMDDQEMKEHDTSLLSDVENPDREDISYCSKCNYGMKKVYYFENHDSVEVTYSPKEIKDLLLKL